jgi:hypothetical protein
MDVSEIRKMREAAEEARLRKDADRVQTNGACLLGRRGSPLWPCS